MRSQRMAIGDNYIDHDNYAWEESDGDGGEIDYLADLVVEGNVGIGTTSPSRTLEISSALTGGTYLGVGNTNTGGKIWSLISTGSGNSNGAGNFMIHESGVGAQFTIKAGGNVGIGTTSPTVQFERVCPAGFTSVKAGNNQLGCIETAEHGTGTWYAAANTCFTTYGGKLPNYSEWYVAMNNYALTGETGNWEWLGNSDYYSASACAIAGASTLTAPNVNDCGVTYAYRCWIPR